MKFSLFTPTVSLRIVFGCLFILLFSGCGDGAYSDCVSPQPSIYHVSNSGKLIGLYFRNNGSDTFAFTDQNGDTFSVCLEKIDTIWTAKSFGNPDCPTLEQHEAFQAKYRVIKGRGSFNVAFNEKRWLTIRFNNYTFERSIGGMGDPNSNDYIGKIIVNGKEYQHINRVKAAGKDSDTYASLSVNYGLVKVEDLDKNLSYLLIPND